LDAGLPTGYSAAGEGIEVGGEVEAFKAGDLVACAGAGIANHAEIIDVPVNLVTRGPAGGEAGVAATCTPRGAAGRGGGRGAPAGADIWRDHRGDRSRAPGADYMSAAEGGGLRGDRRRHR